MSSTRMGGSGSSGRMSLIVQLGAVVATALEEVGGASQHDTVVEVSTGLGAESSEPEEVYQKHKVSSKYPGSCGLPYQFVLQDHNYGAPPPPTPPLSPTANRQGESDGIGSGNNRGSSMSEVTLSGAALKLERGDDEDSRASVLSSPRHGLDGEPEEGEETETAPEGEEEDDSVTRCICNFEHDDGYMICCDKCFVWQHVDCMGIDRSNIPDEYQCERCQPRRVDRTRARALQLRKREELSHHHSDSSSSSSSSSSRSPIPSAYSVSNGPNSAGVGDISDDTISSRRKRRTSSSSSLAAARAKSAAENKKVAGMKRKKQEAPRELNSNTSVGVNAPHQQSQAASNRNAATSQRPLRRRKRRDSMKGAEYKRATAKRRGKASKSLGSDEVMGDEETQDSWEVGNTGGSGAVQLRRWIDNYEEAVTNHYSPELRARLSAIRVNGIHSGLNSGTNGLGSLNISSHHSSASKCRVTQLEPGIRALVASSYLHTNQIVIEIRGKYMLGTQHRQQSSIAKRYPPFLFFYELPKDGTEVCVDARTYGNAARFIRRSCRPNAEVRHCIEKGVLHLYIVTTTNIEKNAEITILHESHHQQLDSHGHLICACNSKDCTAPAPYKRNGFMETDRDRRRRGRRTISSEGDTEPPSIPSNPNQTTASHSISRKGPKSPTKVQPVTPPANPHPQNIQEDSNDATRADSDLTEVSNKKKLTREERKMEAIMKAFERLEKAEQRRQEVLARQAQRKEQDVGSTDGRVRREEDAVAAAVVAAAAAVASKRAAAEDEEDDDDKPDGIDIRHMASERPRRKGRKGRGRLAGPTRRNSRVHSGDGESDLTSADEGPTFTTSTAIPAAELHPVNSLPISTSTSLTSVPVVACPSPSSTSPSPSSSSVPWACENGSSPAVTPQLPISTLPYGSHSPINNIAFAGPLTPGFKFPKTKKVLMNEWLNKGPSEAVSVVAQPLNSVASPLPNKTEVNSFPHSPVVGLGSTGLLPLSHGRESLACALVAAAIGSPLSNVSPGSVTTSDTGVGSAKKRWLRQAIRDETDSPASNACCSPNSRAGSPPCSTGDYVTPLKKRRLARESMSSEQSFTPPTTPVGACENEVGNNSTSPPPPSSNKLSPQGKNSHSHESVVEHEDEEEEEYEEEEEEEEEEDGGEEVVECVSANNTQAQSGDEPNDGDDGVGEANEESDKARETLVTAVSRHPGLVEEVVAESVIKDVIKPAHIKLEESASRKESSVYCPKGSNSIMGNLRKNGISHKELPFSEVKDSPSQPATKRKLSISEYRKRKLRASGDEKTDGKGDKEAYGSPPLLRSSGSLDSSSETDQLSAKDECRILAKATSLTEGSDYDKKGSEEKPSELNYTRWNSAPTLVERQRENLTQRLKREFGLCVGEEEEQERLRKHLGIPEVLDKVLGKESGCEAKLSSRMLVAQSLAAPPPPPKSSPPHTNLPTPTSGTVGHLSGSRATFSPVNIKSVQISVTSQPGPLYTINGGGPVGIPNTVGTNVAGVSSYGYQGMSCVPSVSLPPPPPPPLPPQYQLSSVHPFSVTSPNSSSPAIAGRPSRAPGQAAHLGASSVMPPITASAGIQIPATAAGNIIVSPSVRAASKTFFGQGFLPSRT